jgi:ABC-type multidrug transport system fused ATPase/permease subunit
MRSLFSLLRLSRRQWAALAVVAVLSSCSTAASLIEPWLYRAVVDDVAGVLVASGPLKFADRFVDDIVGSLTHVPGSARRVFHAPWRQYQGPVGTRRRLAPRAPEEAIATVLVAAVALLLARLISEACRVRGDNMAAKISSEIESGLIRRTFDHVTRLPLRAFVSRPSAAIARQVDQTDQVSPLFVAVSKEIWPELFSLIAMIAILGSMNPELALIALVAVPAYLIVTWRMTRALSANLETYYEQWDRISSEIQATIGGIKTVKSLGAGGYEVERLSRLMAAGYGTFLRRTRTENYFTFGQNMIVAATKAAVLGVGGLRALQHQLTPGDIVLLLAYVDRLYSPVETLTSLYVGLQSNFTSLKRAERLLEEPQAPGATRPPLGRGRGAIEFDSVCFAYDGRDVVRNVSFCIQPGEHVALIGPSGAGKTTLVNLLMGLHPPRSGVIRLDGEPLDRVNPDSVHLAVRAVASDEWLFRTSVRENIRYGRFDATDEDIAAAAERAGLGELLARLPQGLETEIGEGGVTLSAGERQRVLLARAFLARPRVLILDEATANLDYHTEAAVKQALDVLGRNRTMITIAHRRSMLRDVDRVIVIRDGAVEQEGTPEELMRAGGYYADMMRADEAPR